MVNDRLQQLLIKYSTDTISKDELKELLDHVAAKKKDPALDRLLMNMLEETQADSRLAIDTEGLYQRIVSHRNLVTKRTRKATNWTWYGAAALLVFVFGAWITQMYVNDSENNRPTGEVVRTVTTAPSERPLLRLADGRFIDLDSVSDGILAIEEGIHIKLQGDVLYYQGKPAGTSREVPMNTIAIPKGRQYQVALPDGSRLWLNAASKVTYPVVFDDAHRELDIDGEVYFEVEHAADWPFVVTTPTQRIEVLGTNFNVSAYGDDNYTKTTLVEGSVKVSSLLNFTGRTDLSTSGAVLKPGQQAVTSLADRRFAVNTVDPADIVSWKENLFVFHNEEISEVMRKISRWYDVEIEYKDGMAGKRIGGSIPILTRVEDIMEALKDTGLLHYEMRGGTIVIMR